MASQGTTPVEVSSGAAAVLNRQQAIALRLDPLRVLLGNGLAIALLGVFGVLYLVYGSPLGVFDLDGERNAPATYSAALWTCVSLVALLLWRVEQPAAAARVWQTLSVPLLLVAADEFGEIHERLERITGIDWQILYSPLGLVAVVLWILVGRRLRELQAGFGLFVAGTVCGLCPRCSRQSSMGPTIARLRPSTS